MNNVHSAKPSIRLHTINSQKMEIHLRQEKAIGYLKTDGGMMQTQLRNTTGRSRPHGRHEVSV
jgi:hypothetical protein